VARLRDHVERLRRASVRWILAFRAPPPGLATLRERVTFPELREPLGLYELADPLPRAFCVEDLGRADQVSGSCAAALERADAHTVRVRTQGSAGYVVVTEGYRPGWRAVDAAGTPRPVTVANGRYWAIPLRAESETFTVRYRPGWRAPALGLCALGLALTTALLLGVRRSPRPGRPAAA
jgi:hypothetical protein